MDTKLVVLATVLCSMLIMSQVSSEALEDQLPDTTGLFFGKRNHPNMNNLLFGRRSSLVNKVAARLEYEDARLLCRSVRTTCAKYGLEEEN